MSNNSTGTVAAVGLGLLFLFMVLKSIPQVNLVPIPEVAK